MDALGVVLWFYLMQAEYTLVHARPALTYALVHSRESENYNTSRSLGAVGNLCVCFLNIKEGGKTDFQEYKKQFFCQMACNPSSFDNI